MIRIVGAENSSQETKSRCCFPQPQKTPSSVARALLFDQEIRYGGL